MPADLARIMITRDLLTQRGVTLADLHDGETPTAVVPMLAGYLPRVIAAAGSGAKRTYGSYWTRMVAVWGARPLDQISASDIEAMQQQMAATARSRRNSRHGRYAGEHVIAAARAIDNRAIADGFIKASASPAHRVAKPRRLPSTRRALTVHELDQINATARTSGNDVVLDALLLRLHTETALPPRRCTRLRVRRAPLPDDAILVIRGDDLDPATSRRQAEAFRRRFSDWGRWRLSAFYARNDAEVDDLGSDQLERFSLLGCYRVVDLQKAGFEIWPTFRTPDQSVSHSAGSTVTPQGSTAHAARPKRCISVGDYLPILLDTYRILLSARQILTRNVVLLCGERQETFR